ncbi:hypothetical protein ACFC53_03520 [Enterococcus casseliflavus]|uniref:hypothetical protein n=1 Tax=Enterococcus casseliflavus TaxID=37734 RepID=UPI0035D76311
MREKSLELARKYRAIHQKLPPNNKLFLEVMTYAFLATNGKGTAANIEKISTTKLVDQKPMRQIQYIVTVDLEEG